MQYELLNNKTSQRKIVLCVTPCRIQLVEPKWHTICRIQLVGLCHGNICCIFHNENFEAFLSPAMFLCGVHFFYNSLFRKGVTFLYAMTLTLVGIEYRTVINTVPGSLSAVTPLHKPET